MLNGGENSEVVRKNFISEVVKQLEELKNKGYRIYVVSAGYDIYLKYFIEEFKLDGLMATKIKFKNDICCGCIDGLDCIGNNKITILNDYFKNEPVQEYQSIAYSDSLSDIPLLDYCKEGIVVSPEEKSWADNTKYKKLVYLKN